MGTKSKNQKPKSKGNVQDFIDDARKDPKLYKQMISIIHNKGKGLTPETFMKKFHRLGYSGVSLQSAKSTLATIRSLENPKAWDWHY